MDQAVRKMRLDRYLVTHLSVPDIELAKALILSGKVVVNDQRVDKVGVQVTLGLDHIRLKQSKKFVSRGGNKLDGVIRKLGLSNQIGGRIALDIGKSTGRRTDV